MGPRSLIGGDETVREALFEQDRKGILITAAHAGSVVPCQQKRHSLPALIDLAVQIDAQDKV